MTVSDVSVEPSQTIWNDQDFRIETTCGPTSGTYEVYVQNISHDGFSRDSKDSLSLIAEDETNAEYFIDGENVRDFWEELDDFSAGDYSFFVGCTNETTDFKSSKFSVEVLKTDLIQGLEKDVYYTEQEEELYFSVLKGVGDSDIDIGEDVNFTVSIGGETRDLIEGYNSNDNEWKMSMKMPSEPGNYEPTLKAYHNGTTESLSREIKVEERLQFDATVSDTTIFDGKAVEVDVEAANRGKSIEVVEDDIDFSLDGDDLDNVSVKETSRDGASTFSVFLPNMSRGNYDLDIEFSREDFQASETVKIKYPARLEGEFRGEDDDALPFVLRFLDDGKEVRKIDSKGDYTSSIVPGTYNVELEFPHETFPASISLEDVDVDSWDGPIRYQFYSSLEEVPGMKLAGLYAYMSALDSESRSFSLGYSTENIDNPRDMEVLQCTGWNMESGECWGSWDNVEAEFNYVGSEALFVDEGEGAYAIGVRENLDVRYSVGEEVYDPDDTVQVQGTVRDEDENSVFNASVSLIRSGSVVDQMRTDDQGIFNLSVPSPDTEGSHSLTLEASKEPYSRGDVSFDIEVERPSSISITAPDKVSANAGEERNISMYVSNTGFTTIRDFEVIEDDVPFIKDLEYDTSPIEMNQSREVLLELEISPNVSEDTYTAEPVFVHDGNRKSYAFGITVDPVENSTVSPTGMVASRGDPLKGALPSIDIPSGEVLIGDNLLNKIIFLILVVQAAAVVAVVFRRRAPEEREDLTQTVSYIKEEIGGESQQNPVEVTTTSTDIDDVERERIIRTFSHIRNQIGAD
ncbi:MAG: carboxypeptidase-like regulatory domain-containing protein [Candidatus Nanohaloarchaeota archaeon QJJ-7]|nr:carboxypeptidase-like regulatory domain-containing protein [Candidatus Nanohaloarchaeota archaeon QJJ-7]